MCKISLIVPVFNSGEFTIQCLNALAAQTMDDIEIILVNDHGRGDSIDRIRTFIGEYSGRKHFVLSETPTNSGPGIARNIGMTLAKGKYLAFVDSDDLIEPSYCEKLYNAVEVDGADMACCDAFWGDDAIVTNPEYKNKKYYLSHFVSYLWTYIVSKDMVRDNDISFPASFCAEDTAFITCCILSANKVARVNEPLYHYLVHNDSVSREKNGRRASARIRSVRSIIIFAKRKAIYRKYRCVLTWLLLKKGYGMAMKDILFG